MTTTTASPMPIAAESALEKERRLFDELFLRLRDALLNRLFDLRPEKARNRMSYLTFLFVISGLVISMVVSPDHSLTQWIEHVRNFFLYLFNPNSAVDAAVQGRNYINELIVFAWEAVTDPRTLQYLPILLASYFIAQHSAALYLADIFEISDISVARSFINEVALTGSDDTIRITQGEVLEEHRSSPNYLIGGPGRVLVDLDSVALFEKPDGTPHIIGPTGKEKGGKATIEGFERFRQAIDIRDHYVDLRDQDDKSPSVKGRSLDGIPITATDVRLMFSVNRNGKKTSAEVPYPFSPQAIEKLVYSAGSKVTPDQSNPSAFEFSWINNMISLIRGKLGGFMSERKLTVYLASIGQPEFEKAKQREEELVQQEKQLTPSANDVVQGKEIKPPPEFVPRYKITNLFTQFAEEFTKTTRDRGVELHWIGVGTWKTPLDMVPEKHLDAWKLSQENLFKGSPEALGKFENETILNKTMTLLQDVPITPFNNKVPVIDDKKKAMRALLLDYRQQLVEIAELMKANGEQVSDNVIRAIQFLSDVLGFSDWHWIGSDHPTNGKPPTNGSPNAGQAESPRTTEFIYEDLVQLVRGDTAVADRLIDFERKQFPNESREQLINRAIQRLTRDRK
jgi:hypothetical protein